MPLCFFGGSFKGPEQSGSFAPHPESITASAAGMAKGRADIGLVDLRVVVMGVVSL